jgi:hypothetical protein
VTRIDDTGGSANAGARSAALRPRASSCFMAGFRWTAFALF